MATCPYCKGHLTEGHRCPKRRVYVVAEILVCIIAGGLAGLLLLAAFDPRGQATDMDGTAITIGAVVAVGINRFLRS
jgi:uncharacterized membrane protein (DUF485 family)